MVAFDALLFWQSRAEKMEAALKKLAFVARTSGGVAGRDEALCKACDEAEDILLSSRWSIVVRDRWGTLVESADGLTWEEAEEISEKYTYTEEFPYQIEMQEAESS